jgi:hypothetical protein
VDSRTAAVAIVDTKSLLVEVMVALSFSAQRLIAIWFGALPALRFEEGVRRAKAFFLGS